jgi:tol-pal system protein YbgF
MDRSRSPYSYAIGFLTATVCLLSLVALGCGSSESSTEDWETTPTISPTAQLEYKVDSLTNENRRMKEQVDAVTAENRTLTAKNAELETRLTEAMANAKPAPMPAPSGDLRSAYESAVSLVRQKNYTDAIDQFQGLLKAGIADDLASNCHYWIGESYYGLRKYQDAVQAFEMVFDYKKSSKKDDAQLMIGNSYYAAGNKEAAKEAYQKLVSGYPTSPFVSKAEAKLAKLK